MLLVLALVIGLAQASSALSESSSDPTLGQWVLEREAELQLPEFEDSVRIQAALPLVDDTFAIVTGRIHELLAFDLSTGTRSRRRSHTGLADTGAWNHAEFVGTDRDHLLVAPGIPANSAAGPPWRWERRRFFDLSASFTREEGTAENADLPGVQVAPRPDGWWCSKAETVVALDPRFAEVGVVRSAEGPASFRGVGDLDTDADGCLAVLERRASPDGLCALAPRPDDAAPDVVHLVDAGGTLSASFEPPLQRVGYVERVQLGRRSLLLVQQSLGRRDFAHEVTRDGLRSEPVHFLKSVEGGLRDLAQPELHSRYVWLDDAGDALIVLLRSPCRVLSFRRARPEELPRPR